MPLFTPWEHIDPFRAGTLVRADEVNVKLDGVATSFGELSELTESRTLVLPDGFQGNNVIQQAITQNSLLWIDANGNIGLYDKSQFDADVQATADHRASANQSETNAANSASAAANDRATTANLKSDVELIKQQAVIDTNERVLLAEKWAQHPEDTAVESGKYSAYHWAQKAQEYAGAVDYNWSAIQGKPATATRWPSWNEVTSKPATFIPAVSYASDLNFTVEQGFYETTGGTANNPDNRTVTGVAVLRDSIRAYQIQMTTDGDFRWRAGELNGSNWDQWKNVYHTGNKPSWSEVTSKPSTFTPSSHSHGYDDTTFTNQNLRTSDRPSFEGINLANNERDDYDIDGLLYWDLSEGLYIKSSNSNYNAPALQWSHSNVETGPGISVSYDSRDRPTISVDGSVTRTNYIYKNGNSTVSLSRGGYSKHIILVWSASVTVNLNGPTFESGDEIKIINERPGGSITVNNGSDRIYIPDGTFANSHTLTEPGTINLVSYNGTHFMAQVY